MPQKKTTTNKKESTKNGSTNSSKKKNNGSTKTENFKVAGGQVVDKVKELIKEGNIRKITIKDKNGKSIVEFPLTIGVVGAVFAPVLAGIGAIAALIGECTISVERDAE